MHWRMPRRAQSLGYTHTELIQKMFRYNIFWTDDDLVNPLNH